MNTFKPLIFGAVAAALAIAPAMAQTITKMPDGTVTTTNQQGTAPGQSTPPSSQTAPGQDPGTVTHGPSGTGATGGGGK
jgi:hypothetical protein